MIIGNETHKYEVAEGWGKLPEGMKHGCTHGVVVDSKDRVFIFNQSKDAVIIFDRDGKFIKSWGGLKSPHTIATDSRGRLFVGDRDNNRIQLFDQEGRYLETWNQFARPSGITITRDDTIYVADSESWGPDQPGWKKGIRIGSAKDGSVKYFIEDMESTTIDHSGAEGVGVDADGNVYGAVVRRQMLEKHIRAR